MAKKQPKPIALNAEQQAAADVREGIWVVRAGPGSGKTTVLCTRYKSLITDGVGPQDILCLTFTSNAADEMQKRARVERVPGKPSGFRTFHAFCLAFCIAEREKFTFRTEEMPLIGQQDQNKFLAQACRVTGANFKRLSLYISQQKRQRTSPAQALEEAGGEGLKPLYALAYQYYEEACRKAGVLDFDALIVETVNLLERCADVRAKYQYKYVMTDESQDTDFLQLRLVQLLSEQHGNLFAVGDINQAIYAWRGAAPNLFQDFMDMFPAAQKLFLPCNHRSTKRIVSFISEIAPDRELGEKFYTNNEGGVDPEIRQFASDYDEANFILDTIRHSGQPPESFAALARTNRQLLPIQMTLADAGVPYKLLSSEDYWKQPEIKGVLAYLQLVISSPDHALIGALVAPFEPSKFIRKRELVAWLKPFKGEMWDALCRYDHDAGQRKSILAFQNFIASLARYRGHKAGDVVRGIIRDTRALDHYAVEDDLAELNNRPVENLVELARIADRFPSIGEMLQYVWRLQAASRKRKGVQIGTIHSFKGREADTVFVLGASEGLLPHKLGELDEEARLAFVAASRARKRLFITYTGTLSRFFAGRSQGDSLAAWF